MTKSYRITIPMIRYYVCYIYDVADQEEAQKKLEDILYDCDKIPTLDWYNDQMPNWNVDEMPDKYHPAMKNSFAWDFEDMDDEGE